MQEVLDEGKDLGNFLWEMIKHTKDILMYKVSKINNIYSEEEIRQIAEISEKVSKEELINIIYKLSELDNKMKISSQKTIIFETEIIKLCVKQDTLGLEERIENLEKKIAEGNTIERANTIRKEPVVEAKKEDIQSKIFASQTQETKKIKQEETTEKKEFKSGLSKGNITSDWQNVLSDLKKQGKVMLYANLINTEAVEINDMTVGIIFNNGLNSFRKELLQKPENMNVLVKEISMVCGKPMQIKLEDGAGSKADTKKMPEPIQTKEPVKEESEEDILNSLDIPINIVEE